MEQEKQIEKNIEKNIQKKDIFDKIMALPGLNIFESIYYKYKEVLLYLFYESSCSEYYFMDSGGIICLCNE